MYLPSLVVIAAPHITVANAVFAALTSGMRVVGVRLSSDPEAAWDASPSHYYMMDMSALDSDVAEWQAMTEGDLPAINGEWGVGAVPAAAAAQVAFADGNMQVYSAAGIDTAGPFVEGVLLGAGLYRIPDEPIE